MIDEIRSNPDLRPGRHWNIDFGGVVAALLASAFGIALFFDNHQGGWPEAVVILWVFIIVVPCALIGILLQIAYLAYVLPRRRTWGTRWVIYLQIAPVIFWIFVLFERNPGSSSWMLKILKFW
jgi:hypothetical protein